MRTVIVKESQGNRKVERILKEAFPKMPVNAVFKAFRKKDIKVNGVRIKEDCIALPGDVIEVYIKDDILDGLPADSQYSPARNFETVYEDENILIVNKEQGIPVHPDRDQPLNTLIDQVRAYLSEKGSYNQSNPYSYPPSLCHRLDRNTGGLVIIAKNEESLRVILSKIKSKEIKKFYQCLVKGAMESSSGELKAYLKKDENKSRVFIRDENSRDSLEIITRYKLLSYENDISKLEVELVTGRTHQIRAHLAHIGHPIIGDGKYGLNSINRLSDAKYQALWAYKIVFDFKDAGILNYLKGRKFEVIPEFKLKSKNK